MSKLARAVAMCHKPAMIRILSDLMIIINMQNMQNMQNMKNKQNMYNANAKYAKSLQSSGF